MVAAEHRVQHQPRPVADLRPAGQNPRIVALRIRIPGHHRHMTRRPTRIDPGACPVGNLPQHRGDPPVGEAEPQPRQVPAVHQAGQHLRQLARIRPPVFRGRQHDAVRLVVLAVREQHRQLILTEHVPGPPPVQPQLILPGGEPRRRGPRPHPHPHIHYPGVIVGGHHRRERAPAHHLLHRRPGPPRLRIHPGPQHLPQHLPVTGHPELLTDDLHDLLRVFPRQCPARPGFLRGNPRRRRVHQLGDQPVPQRIQRRRHSRSQERHRRTRVQIPAQPRQPRAIHPRQLLRPPPRQPAQIPGRQIPHHKQIVPHSQGKSQPPQAKAKLTPPQVPPVQR